MTAEKKLKCGNCGNPLLVDYLWFVEKGKEVKAKDLGWCNTCRVAVRIRNE